MVLLDLQKAYNTVDRDRLLQTLEGYGAGPCMCGLLNTFWAHQQVVPRQNGYHGPALQAIRGTTQGDLLSPTLFNVVVYNFIHTWLAMTVEYQRVAHYGLVEAVRKCVGVFYANDSMVVSRDPDWMNHLMNVLVSLFQQYGLAYNVAKSCSMTCQPGVMRLGMSVEAKSLKSTGVGYSYFVRIWQRIPFPEWVVELTMVSMMAQFCCMHGTEPVIYWSRLPASQT